MGHQCACNWWVSLFIWIIIKVQIVISKWHFNFSKHESFVIRLHKIQWFQLWNSRESCPKLKNGQWPYFCYSITGTCRNRSELCRNITGTVRNLRNIASKSRGKIIKAPKISPVLTDFNQFLTDFNLFQPVGIKKLLIIPARVTMAHLNVYDKMDQSKLLLVKVFHIFGEMKLSVIVFRLLESLFCISILFKRELKLLALLHLRIFLLF